MVMEYLSLGPLDIYLREHKTSIKQVDLVEAGAFLATALWHLVSSTFIFTAKNTFIMRVKDNLQINISN